MLNIKKLFEEILVVCHYRKGDVLLRDSQETGEIIEIEVTFLSTHRTAQSYDVEPWFPDRIIILFLYCSPGNSGPNPIHF
jgi:hypothetical protein